MLRGDPSDGLPGVKGIGEKTAAKLITEYFDFPGLIAAAKDDAIAMPPAVRRNILESQVYMKAAGKVVRVKTSAKLPKSLLLPKTIRDPASLALLMNAWGVEKQVARLLKTLGVSSVT